jgi:DNA replication protein DnaC
MNYSISKAVAAVYEETRLKAERERQLRRDSIHANHPELARLDREIAAAGADMLFEAIDPDRPRTASARKAGLEAERLSYMAQNGVDAGYDRIVYSCGKCLDTGKVGRQLCSCYRQVMMPLLISNANLKTLSGITFDSFDESLFSAETDQKKNQSGLSPRDNIRAIRSALERFVAAFEDSAANLLFLGRPGTGKTFLMACLANEVLKKGHMVFYVSAPELFEILSELRVQQASFQPDPVRLEQLKALQDSLLNAELLLIDDLGTESRGANRYSELLSLIDRRLAPGLHTVISSNADALALKETYDERLLSRLMGNYSIYRFFGDDVRLQISRRRRG